jgi:hypothetical protein
MELVRRLNMVAKEDNQLPISLYEQNANYTEFNGKDTLRFHITGYREHRDTLFTPEKKIDTVYVYKIPIKDTAYISHDLLYYELNVEKYFYKNDKNYCNSVIAKCLISEERYGSSIYIISFDTYNCYGIFDKNMSKQMERLQKIFDEKLNKK